MNDRSPALTEAGLLFGFCNEWKDRDSKVSRLMEGIPGGTESYMNSRVIVGRMAEPPRTSSMLSKPRGENASMAAIATA